MRPPAGSRALAVTGAIKAACDAISGTTVLYLAEGGRETRLDTVSVAVGKNAIAVQRQKAPGLGIHYIETMRIVCKISSRSGSKDPAVRMTRVGVIFDALAAALLADPRLGGACDEAMLGPEEMWSAEDGPGVSVQFTVLTKTNV